MGLRLKMYLESSASLLPRLSAMLISTCYITGRLFLCVCQTRWHPSAPDAHVPCLAITVELDILHPSKSHINLRKDTNLVFLSHMHFPESILGTPIAGLGHMLTQEVGTGHSDWHHHLDHEEWRRSREEDGK